MEGQFAIHPPRLVLHSQTIASLEKHESEESALFIFPSSNAVCVCIHDVMEKHAE